MFEPIRRRLLLSYLLALGITLASSAVAVRFLFAHSLSQQLTEKLISLGQATSSSMEPVNGKLRIDKSDLPPESLIGKEQALEWFDLNGKSIDQQGHYLLNLPFAGGEAVQTQAGNPGIRGVTLPVVDSDTKQVIGYIRSSQSLAEFDEALRHFDWGMAGGILVALGLSAIGGIWVTRQAMKPIEESFAQLKQFTADASHELRSPLMAIGSNAQVALRYPEGIRPGDAEKFALIESTVKQLTHLTEDLLLLARTDSQPIAQHQPIRLDKLLADLVQLYQPHAEAKAIALDYKTAASLYADGDEPKLRRLFINLIDNALNYTPPGGQVMVQSRIQEGQLLITVTDTGIGIPSDQISRVFDRFWRAESSRHYQSGGSGLGLAIVQAIVKQHQGTIAVTSRLGAGTCFSVRLPACSANVYRASGNAKSSQKSAG